MQTTRANLPGRYDAYGWLDLGDDDIDSSNASETVGKVEHPKGRLRLLIPCMPSAVADFPVRQLSGTLGHCVSQEILRAGDYLMLRTVVSGLWVYVNTSGVPMLG